MARRKHPFHWDTYSKLYDALQAIAESDDPRMYRDVQRAVDAARAQLAEAWNLQCQLERADGERG
ncbi:protein of unknown function [Magnetospirillum sp. XM-1]|uniref:hypothetical protein n=1 Tax=Magnetospirillum sp. XM-1 TaxID=1663591 RepID=UPI00073DF1FF|nr:hypothetical protein [Magnetospirillum sp. XM-1]CUW39699.1 protein of unknown function [Magnetospirillum sp. XM-1]